MKAATFEIRVPKSPGAPLRAARELWEAAYREGLGGAVFEFHVLRREGAVSFFLTVPENLGRFFWDQCHAMFPDAEISFSAEAPLRGAAWRSRLSVEGDFTAEFRTAREEGAGDPADALWAAVARAPAGGSAALRFVADPLEEFPGTDLVAELLEGPDPYEAAEEAPVPDAPVPDAPEASGWKALAAKWGMAALRLSGRAALALFSKATGLGREAEEPAANAGNVEWGRAHLRQKKGGQPLFFANLELVAEAGSAAEAAAWADDAARALNGAFAEKEARFRASAPVRADDLAWSDDGYGIVLSAAELAYLAHLPGEGCSLPGVAWVRARPIEPPADLAAPGPDDLPVASAVWRGYASRPFGLSADDRMRHVYAVGKTGMGKTTLIANMLAADVDAGRGCGVIDPHGDLVESLLARIPARRTNDLVIFDPADAEWPVGFNLLELPDPRMAALAASGVVGVFKKMFSESWGPRLEHVLRNAAMTLLSVPDSTLLHVPQLLTDARFRARALGRVADPVLRAFWETEFPAIAGNRSSDALGAVLNKVGQFLSSPVVRNVVGQPKSGFSPSWVMDNGKILLVNLSKGRLGEDAASLLGALVVTKFQLDAMARAAVPEADRRDFFLYVDEFQNFATDSFASVLSEARKYRLSLSLAHQYVDQLPKPVRDAVFGNVGTTVAFQVGHADAAALAPLFGDPRVGAEDLANVPRFEAYVKTLRDGRSLPPFRARMNPPAAAPDRAADVETLKRVNRDKFARPRAFVEGKIAKSFAAGKGKGGEAE